MTSKRVAHDGPWPVAQEITLEPGPIFSWTYCCGMMKSDAEVGDTET